MVDIMKKKISNIVFIIIFMAILVIPVIFMNTKPNQISEIDNKILTEWPGFSASLATKGDIENYFNDRIGFREKAIEGYIELNDKLFNVMVHPLFMYGKEGHIYFKDSAYISAYQRLNTDTEYLDDMVDYLDRTKDYLDEKGIPFVVFVCPDKKTIYPEYFPDEIHVNEDNESVLQHVEKELAKTDIDYIIPTEELLAAKKDEVIYNKLYDATHWNALGAMKGQKLLDEKLREKVDGIAPLDENDFDLSYEKVTTLDVARFPIDEDVPKYTLKNDTSESAAYYLSPYIKCPNPSFYNQYVNRSLGNGKKLLVFMDSYFTSYSNFYTGRFEEVYFVHRGNYDHLEYLVNLVFPDAVIFETAERSITGEMPGTCFYKDCYYEMPYKGTGGYETSDEVSITLTNVTGVRPEGNILYLNPDEGDNIVCIEGIVEADRHVSIYAKVDDNYLETDYCALHRESEEEGLNKWSLNIQRRYLAQGPIDIIGVDDNGNEYLLETFEVVYGQ